MPALLLIELAVVLWLQLLLRCDDDADDRDAVGV